MNNRLTRIVTKSGDGGNTGLADGKRVAKDAKIIHAIGDIDELNSSIGMVRSHCKNKDLDRELQQLQRQLFNLGGDLCLPGSVLLNAEQLSTIEESLAHHNKKLAPLKDFILPAGSELTVRLHMARSICRRAERSLVAAAKCNEFNPLCLPFINRLSDYLFVLARSSNELAEMLW